MPIWSVRSVTSQPSLRLRDWSIIEIQNGDRHFVGYNVDDSEGRVSTAIREFDPKTRRGVTSSGRVYQLLGEPGYDPDAAHVWEGWKRVNSVLSSKNVTEEVLSIDPE
jgi:hypothetical protein